MNGKNVIKHPSKTIIVSSHVSRFCLSSSSLTVPAFKPCLPLEQKPELKNTHKGAPRQH